MALGYHQVIRLTGLELIIGLVTDNSEGISRDLLLDVTPFYLLDSNIFLTTGVALIAIFEKVKKFTEINELLLDLLRSTLQKLRFYLISLGYQKNCGFEFSKSAFRENIFLRVV